MKKFFRSFAIVALALVSTGFVTSCGSDDDSKDPDPKDVLVPIDQIEGKITYNFSSETLEMFSIKYEVTDFDGKQQTIEVTKPGKEEKVFKAKKITDVANVKMVIEPKDVKKVGTGDVFNYKFFTIVTLPIYAGGMKATLAERVLPTLQLSLDNYNFSVEQSPEAIKFVQDQYVGWYEVSLALPEQAYKGVSKDWLIEHKE